MELPEEIIRKGSVRFYSDSPAELKKAAEDHNELMGILRVEDQKKSYLEGVFYSANIFFMGVMLAVDGPKVFHEPVIAAVILGVFFLLFMIFAFFKKSLFPPAVFSIFLVFLSVKFVMLMLIDLGIAFFHQQKKDYLMTKPGYPEFRDILITYDRNPTPSYEKKNEAFAVSHKNNM